MSDSHIYADHDETCDLRNHPINKKRAIRLAYGALPLAKASDGIRVGTQARFIDAAMAAANAGQPLNTLLSVRWDSLFSDNDVKDLRTMPISQRIDHIVERFRKWWKRRGLPVHYIWVREAADRCAEHWHIAFHLPKELRLPFARYLAELTQEPLRPTKRPADQRTEGEFACSEIGSWHLAGDTRPDRRGYFLAAYLGKGEPSQIIKRGKRQPNFKKPVRGQSFGGTQRDGKYDVPQGAIMGTNARMDRFYISNELKNLAKGKAKKKGKSPRKTDPKGRAQPRQRELLFSAENRTFR